MKAKKKGLTKEGKRQIEEREIYLSCLFIDESERKPQRGVLSEYSFEDLLVECILA